MAKQSIEQILDSIDKKVKSRLEKLLAGLTSAQRMKLIENPKLIDELLKDYNPDELAKYYSAEFSALAGKVVISYTDKINALQKARVNVFVNMLKDLKTESLREFINSNKVQFKNKLVELIVNGSDRNIVKEYFAKTPFTDRQIGTLINTAESDIRRATVLSAFGDRKDLRYEYIGGIIPTSSETCTWLMNNQNPEGYTLEEIQAGIETPYGLVDWGGRIPNYNCIHSWSAILE